VDLSQRPFKVKGTDTEIEAETLIIATGATAKRLNVPSEERLWNRGMSACAVCDGALPRFKGQDLLVIGGGDTACEEAQYLTKFANKVYIVHRRDELRASKIMAQRTIDHEKIDVLWNSVLEDAVGETEVTGAKLRNMETGEITEIPCKGIFYGIGHKPNTDFLKGQVQTDEAGYIVPKTPGRSFTSVEGVFAAGDVMDHVYRQAITAAGSGCAAALDAERWLAEHA
ncbi:thioredoxin-disulfide reductase, partial [bacterium F16]